MCFPLLMLLFFSSFRWRLRNHARVTTGSPSPTPLDSSTSCVCVFRPGKRADRMCLHLSGSDIMWLTVNCSVVPSALARASLRQSHITCPIVSSASSHSQYGSSSASILYLYCFSSFACPVLRRENKDRTLLAHTLSTSNFGFLRSPNVSCALACCTSHFTHLMRAFAVAWVTGIPSCGSFAPSSASPSTISLPVTPQWEGIHRTVASPPHRYAVSFISPIQ